MEGLHIAQVGEWFHEEDQFHFLSDQNMNEYDFIVIETDTFIKNIKDASTARVERRILELKEFIASKNIPIVFFCFGGGVFYTSSGRQQILTELLGLDVTEVLSSGRKIETNSDTLFSEFLNNYNNSLEYNVSFSKHPGISVGKAKSKNNSIGFYTRDFVFLPGLHEDGDLDETAFLRDLHEMCCKVRRGSDTLHLPEWADRYLLPGEQTERDQLDKINKELKRLKEAKSESELRLSNFSPLKQLWTASGSTLEYAVKQVFTELGFVMLPSKERRDDLIMEFNGQVVVAEIKGQNKSAAERNAAQLEKWVSTYITDHGGKGPKGLLIVNTFREQPLENRTLASFPNQMLSYSMARKHCLLTTVQLCSILLFCRANPDKKDTLIRKLLKTVGCFEGFENWSEYITVHDNASVAQLKKNKSK